MRALETGSSILMARVEDAWLMDKLVGIKVVSLLATFIKSYRPVVGGKGGGDVEEDGEEDVCQRR